jgi:hypothetical protein
MIIEIKKLRLKKTPLYITAGYHHKVSIRLIDMTYNEILMKTQENSFMN